MLWCGGDEFSTADDMGDAHEMVVDDVGKVVGRHAIAFDEDLIFQGVIINGDVAMDDIEVGSGAGEGHFLTDDKGFAFGQVFVDDFLWKVAAGTVIAAKSAFGMFFIWVAEATISMAFFDEFIGIFLIDFHAFTLDVWTAVTTDVRSFIRDDMGCGQCPVDEVNGIRYIAFTIGIFNPQDEISLVGFGKEIGVEGSPEIADMHVARRAWRETGTYFFSFQF